MCVCVCVCVWCQEWQYRLELPKLCYHSGWWLMRLGYRTCFHMLYDEKKKYIYILLSRYIYIYIYIYVCVCVCVYTII